MRALVLPEALRVELSRCTKVAAKDGKAAVRAVYACIELSAGDGVLSLRVMDEHLCFVSAVSCETKEVGTVLVDCNRLAAILAVRSDGVAFQIWNEGTFLHIKQGEFKAKIPLLRNETMPACDFSGPFDVDMTLSEEMLHGLRRCRRTVEEDSVFAGLLLDFSEAGTLRVAAFTRALLQVAHFDVQGVSSARVVLAPRCIPLLESMDKAAFRFSYSKAQAQAYFFTATFAVRIACVDDKFPAGYAQVLGLHKWRSGDFPVPLTNNVGAIVSEHTRSQLVFNRRELLAAMECAATALGKDEQIIEMKVGQCLSDGSVVVEFIGSNTTTKAHATEKVLAKGEIPAAISLGLNYPCMRDALRHLDDDELVLHIGRKEDAIVITENAYKHIVAIATLMRL